MMGHEGPVEGLRRELGMTIYGFAREDDYIILAADGIATWPDEDAPKGHPKHFQGPIKKLAQVPGTMLLRGGVGRFSDAQKVDQWLSGQRIDNWTSLADGLGSLISDLNAGHLQRAHKAHRRKETVERSSLVLAGYLDGRLDVLLVGDDGDTIRDQQRWGFLGCPWTDRRRGMARRRQPESDAFTLRPADDEAPLGVLVASQPRRLDRPLKCGGSPRASARRYRCPYPASAGPKCGTSNPISRMH
jgi:hypothetical protein